MKKTIHLKTRIAVSRTCTITKGKETPNTVNKFRLRSWS